MLSAIDVLQLALIGAQGVWTFWLFTYVRKNEKDTNQVIHDLQQALGGDK